MGKFFQRILVCLLSAGMVCGLGGVTALAAEDTDAAIDDAENLEDDSGLPYEGTIEASDTPYTFTLSGVHEMTGALTIEAGANVTVDLNGCQWLVCPDTSVTVNGTLTITDTSAEADGYVTRDGSVAAAAIIVSNGGELNLRAGAIKEVTGTGNYYSTSGGAAVSVADTDSTFNMYGGEISDNTAGGGGAVSARGTFNLYDGKILDNVSTSFAGAIYLGNYSVFNMSGGLISGNTATASSNSRGGVIYTANYATITISGGEISDNRANNQGGAIYYAGASSAYTLTISGGTITNNASVDSSGGGVYVSSGSVVISGNAAIYGNTAGGGASDIYKASSSSASLKIVDPPEGLVLFTDSHPVCHEIDGWYTDDSGDRWSDQNITEKVDAGTYYTALNLIAAHGRYPKADHEWDADNPTIEWSESDGEWTCTATVTCSRCGEEAVAFVTPQGVVTPPTCTEDGYTTYEANITVNDSSTGQQIGTYHSEKVVVDEGTALGHEWGAWEIITPATIGENGERSHTCIRCGYTETEEYAVDVEEAEDLINEADKLADDADYTENSRNTLKEAVQDAKDVLDNPESTQEDVDAALAALQNAINGLTKVSTNGGSGSIEIKKDSSDGNWYSYRNGEKVDYTGFGSNAYGKWYVENGKVTFAKTGILKDSNNALGDPGAWYYVIDSKVQTNYTNRVSEFKNAYGWWYIKDGKVDFSANTVAKNQNGWWYVKDGKVEFGHNGVDKNQNGWWYITGGKVNFDFTGLANYKNQYGWWYIKDGKVDFSHNGVDKNRYGWWYVNGGKVDFGFTGIASNQYGTWYVRGGKVPLDFNGTVTVGSRTYNVRNGRVS